MLDPTPTRNVAVNTTMVAIMNAVTDTARVSSARSGSERFVYYLIKMNSYGLNISKHLIANLSSIEAAA